MILVSACLLGHNCKYNGKNNLRPDIIKLGETSVLIPVCPEQLGGLPTPRSPAQFDRAGGAALLKNKSKIIDSSGKDVTENFLTGAYRALSIAQENGVNKAILKERSPSCGVNSVYIIEKGDRAVPGMGVTAALLKQHGINVYSDEQLDEM